jgi:hypothetical protein
MISTESNKHFENGRIDQPPNQSKIIQMLNEVWQKTDESVLLLSVDLKHSLKILVRNNTNLNSRVCGAFTYNLTLVHNRLRTDYTRIIQD